MSVSKAIVVGNLGQDPILRYMDDGTPVTSFSVCANYSSGSGENRTDTPIWYKANFFGNSAEAITKHFQKGDPIYVEGRLKPELWTGDDGKTRLTLNLNRCEFQFVPKRNRANESAAVQTTAETPATAETPGPELEDSDIPF